MIFCSVMLLRLTAMAQDSSGSENKVHPLSFTGFAEAYYSYDFNQPPDNNRPFFLYSHNRHNEFNINLAFLKGSYGSETVRANIALATGTYMNANYAAETGVLKNLYEANVGVRISKKKNLWVDAGIFSSHLGFESAHSPSCWTLTRSLAAENSPYYETGVRLAYTSGNEKLNLSLLALNGWQRITRVNGNSLISWGTQVFWKPSEKITLNYSTFLGTDKPDSARLWRVFHDVYSIIQFHDKLGLILGFDIGTEQSKKGSNEVFTWYTPVGILRFTPNRKWAFALRGEYFSDKNGVIVVTGTSGGFQTQGYSFNIDRSIGENLMWRTEFRTFRSHEPIFTKEGELKKNNSAVTTSMAITF